MDSNHVEQRRIVDQQNDLLSMQQRRKDALHKELAKRKVNVAQLEAALIEKKANPDRGYDQRYGKSAIKAYRSFLYPTTKKKMVTDNNDRRGVAASTTISIKAQHSVEVAARICAQSIDFLIQRHAAHESMWVRHHDPKLKIEVRECATSAVQQIPVREDPQRQHFPIVLVLDNVRSAFNVGSLFRTADATGCRHVYTVGVTPYPGGCGSEKVRRTGLGAERLVPTSHHETIYEALDDIRSSDSSFAHYEVIALETTARSVFYTSHAFSQEKGIVLILGNEVTGVRLDVLESYVDKILEIPMYGAKNSLNVAACAPVVLYEILRQWNG